MAYSKNVGLGVACLGILMCFIYSYYIYFIQLSANLNFMNWDRKTTTTSDFTSQISITKQIWENWNSNNRKLSDGQSFKKYIKDQIEAQMLGKVEVAQIFFAYDSILKEQKRPVTAFVTFCT